MKVECVFRSSNKTDQLTAQAHGFWDFHIDKGIIGQHSGGQAFFPEGDGKRSFAIIPSKPTNEDKILISISKKHLYGGGFNDSWALDGPYLQRIYFDDSLIVNYETFIRYNDIGDFLKGQNPFKILNKDIFNIKRKEDK